MLALALLAAACGDGGTATTTAPPGTAAPTTAAPTTAAPTTTEATTTTTEAAPVGIVPGEDPDVDAVVLAYTIALDSVTDFEEKAPYVEDSADLEETVAEYLTNGQFVGGVGVLPTEVVIDGDTAVVTYDLLFGGNPAHPDRAGDAIKIDDTWKVTRESFCALMVLARGSCP